MEQDWLMIGESSYWKDVLLREAEELLRREKQRKWFPASFARVEQSAMMGFYAVRKLFEAHKLSDRNKSRTFHLTRFRWSGKPVTQMNWHHIDRCYDLSKGEATDKPVRFVCDQFIHSYVFMCVFSDGGGLDGILVSSDEERNKSLYLVPVEQIISTFKAVGKDYPSRLSAKWNPEKLDYGYAAR